MSIKMEYKIIKLSKMLTLLSHKEITPKYYGFCKINNIYYIIMEKYECDLHNYLKNLLRSK